MERGRMRPGPSARPLRKGGTADGWRCGQRAPREAWQGVYAKPRPVLCNRAPGHDGPHRYTLATDFTVLAEWTDAEVPTS